MWQKPSHQQQRTRAFGKVDDTLIMISGPRHARGQWMIRVFLHWPHTKPYGAAIQHDHLATVEDALIEDARNAVGPIVDDFLSQNAEAARRKRDASTVQRLSDADRRAARALRLSAARSAEA